MTLASGARVRLLLSLMIVTVTMNFAKNSAAQSADVDSMLENVLKELGFTGEIEKKKPVTNEDLRLLGRSIFFDKGLALHADNSCAGCHAPQRGFSDTQSIAIGVENNNVVGPNRTGPRNQRRSPMLLNTGFYPKLMLNGRFQSMAGDPFDNSKGFRFPAPEGREKFPPHDGIVKTLLSAQAHIPFTELPEMAGFNGTEGQVQIFSRFGGELVKIEQNTVVRLPPGAGLSKSEIREINTAANTRMSLVRPLSSNQDGRAVPEVDFTGSRNEAIRTEVLEIIKSEPKYAEQFAKLFNVDVEDINFDMVGIALAEFQLALTFANAPIDQFARGNRGAMSNEEKEGALIFFSKEKGNCVSCHSVSGKSNEMFSDFENHNIGVPPLMPGRDGQFTKHLDGNVDFILDQGDIGEGDLDKSILANWYKFRTTPLRNIALQPTFMHNGAFTSLRSAIKHHLDVRHSLRTYDPAVEGVAPGIRNIAPKEKLLGQGNLPFNPDKPHDKPALDPLIDRPIVLTSDEMDALVAFVEKSLLDPRATPEMFCKDIPSAVPSGAELHVFEDCP